MKFLISLYFILALSSLTLGKSRKWGKRQYNDRLLYRENIVRFPIKKHVIEVQVSYPRHNVYPRYNVTAVFVYDRFTNSSGAVPKRIQMLQRLQGVLYNTTTVILKSQNSRGINSTVEIYGKCWKC
ncbi:uncharacterized protein LOC119603341 [Lucilia sericata]|uniref:uncharacterized protein LOC119603341 n=1 Tax=Lucilia sericata TaxID=13632 RepID=UPI0018A84C86|nr:uncharacterized protein LOC119603341 [Lucilia sericata]